MAATLRYGNVTCHHCKGTGYGGWHMAQGACFRCGPNFTKELSRKWFGVTFEWEGRTFKGVVRSYDEAAALEDAADLQLLYLDTADFRRDERGFTITNDPERHIMNRWVRGTCATRVVPIKFTVANKFVCNNPGGNPVREVRAAVAA